VAGIAENLMLELKQLCKCFGSRVVADQLSFEVAPGEIVALLGPSGCGKSTLLKIIAGLDAPDSGQLSFSGKSLLDCPPEKRQFALMFQDYALFPHLNVEDNVMFGLVERRVERREGLARTHEVLATLGLGEAAHQSVETLSGGEAQRVALARALVTRPRLLLLDEPFSSLDAHLRQGLQSEFRQRLKQLGISALWVTHDRQEAFAMADRIVVLHQGQIQQASTPAELLRAPANPWVARFIGFDNVSDQGVVPDAAFVLGAGQPSALIEAVTVLAEGVRLWVRCADSRYTLSLSTREARQLGCLLQAGESIGLGLDAEALIHFNQVPF
jgi:ABC-type Fe3+/spermidine/putrescine transport system ATPase subunit